MFISSIIFSYLFYLLIDLFFLPSGRQKKTSTVLNLFIQNRSAQFFLYHLFLDTIPQKGNARQSWILHPMSWIPDSRYWITVFVS